MRRSAGSGVEVRVRAVRRRTGRPRTSCGSCARLGAPGRWPGGGGAARHWDRTLSLGGGRCGRGDVGLVPVEVMPETPRVEAAVSAPATTTGTPGADQSRLSGWRDGARRRCVDTAVLRGLLADFVVTDVRSTTWYAGVPGCGQRTWERNSTVWRRRCRPCWRRIRTAAPCSAFAGARRPAQGWSGTARA